MSTPCDDTYSTCTDCEGLGVIACGGCGGSGEGHHEGANCRTCGGSGEVECEHEAMPTEDDDEQPDPEECSACHGSGGGRDEMRCPHCLGTGKRRRWPSYDDERDWDSVAECRREMEAERG